jgi:hypothetical protein
MTKTGVEDLLDYILVLRPKFAGERGENAAKILRVWDDMLSDVSDEDGMAAIRAFFRDPKKKGFTPSPQDILDHAGVVYNPWRDPARWRRWVEMGCIVGIPGDTNVPAWMRPGFNAAEWEGYQERAAALLDKAYEEFIRKEHAAGRLKPVEPTEERVA